jgi:hypothetical protein
VTITKNLTHPEMFFKQKLLKIQTKKTTDWGLANQSLRRRTDEEIIRLYFFSDILMQIICQNEEKNK